MTTYIDNKDIEKFLENLENSWNISNIWPYKYKQMKVV